MSTLWEFVDQQDEEQLDFFDLCEPGTPNPTDGLGSQANDEEENGEKV